MTLSLRLKLLLILLVVAATTVSGTWLFMQRAFEQGFVRLVETRQAERLDAVRDALEAEYRAAGSWARVRDDRGRWVQLLVSARGGGERVPRWARRLSNAPTDEWPPRFGPGRRGAEEPLSRDAAHGSRRRPVPLEFRLMLLDGDGSVIIGDPKRVDALEREPLQIAGRTVGYLGVLPGPALNELADVRFVEEQKRRFLLIAGVMVLLAGVVAVPLASVMTGRLRELGRGARALAEGRYETRVVVTSRDELGQLALAFNDLAAALERAETSRRQWVADISHELRTPLATLRGELEALQDGVRPLDRAAVDALHADARRLERLVDDLYDLARSDLGALSYRKRPLQPLAILQADLEALAEEFRQREIRVQMDRQPSEPVTVHADPDRLSQLFRNLLGNSLRYTDPGGVLRIRASRAPEGLVIDAQDSAPGVPDADLPLLFHRFHRVERSRSRAWGGAGLGLAICRNIAEAHGGRLEVRHSELGGLWVRLVLPEAS